MNICYLVFGPQLTLHMQAAFSILSFLCKLNSQQNICILTDQPHFYTFLENCSKVTITTIPSETITEWRGAHNNLFRAKVKAIEYWSNHNPNQAHILYLDGDTFLFDQLENLQQHLDNGGAIMHEPEGELQAYRSKSIQTMHKQLRGMSLHGFTVLPNTLMWNAGVVGLPANKAKELVSETLQLLDHLLPHTTKQFYVEQLCFSIVLNKSMPLEAAKGCIAHYWSNKTPWNEAINNFFTQTMLAGCINLSQKIALMQLFNYTLLPVSVKNSGTATRLKSLVDKIFPAKNIKFIPHN